MSSSDPKYFITPKKRHSVISDSPSPSSSGLNQSLKNVSTDSEPSGLDDSNDNFKTPNSKLSSPKSSSCRSRFSPHKRAERGGTPEKPKDMTFAKVTSNSEENGKVTVNLEFPFGGWNDIDDDDDDDSSDDSSSCSLEIVMSETEQSPVKKGRKRMHCEISDESNVILSGVGEEIERQLEAKAEKNQLSVPNVKNILRTVITHPHVLAMVKRSAIGGDVSVSGDLDDICYEPIFTRAKAKELMKTSPALSWPVPSTSVPPECKAFIAEDFDEDSDDDDEYKPAEEDPSDSEKEGSERGSERDSFIEQSPATLDEFEYESLPPTPRSLHSASGVDCATQTNWSEDGVFKIPMTPAESEPKSNTEENIALRTRSKLPLNDTPLEEIEQAFVPPDITPDLYDNTCDNEDWLNFLTEYMQPLPTEPESQNNDDEEEDPEYNVLAEEEVIDREELRADRAVKISQKELNELMSELFDYTDNFSSNDDGPAKKKRKEAAESELNAAVAFLEENLPAMNFLSPNGVTTPITSRSPNLNTPPLTYNANDQSPWSSLAASGLLLNCSYSEGKGQDFEYDVPSNTPGKGKYSASQTPGKGSKNSASCTHEKNNASFTPLKGKNNSSRTPGKGKSTGKGKNSVSYSPGKGKNNPSYTPGEGENNACLTPGKGKKSYSFGKGKNSALCTQGTGKDIETSTFNQRDVDYDLFVEDQINISPESASKTFHSHGKDIQHSEPVVQEPVNEEIDPVILVEEIPDPQHVASDAASSDAESNVNIATLISAIYVPGLKLNSEPTNTLLSEPQKLVLAQQLRQHVQLLTQHYLQTFRHPTLGKYAPECKAHLVSLSQLGEDRADSAFQIANLPPALKLIEDWEKKLDSREGDSIKKFVSHHVGLETKKVEKFGSRGALPYNFHPQLMQSMMESETFVYPVLLPTRPFVSFAITRTTLTPQEIDLLAVVLDEFVALAAEEYERKGKKKKRSTWRYVACEYICKHIMPRWSPDKLSRHVFTLMQEKGSPIEYVYKNNRAPPTSHYVIPFDANKMIPLKQQPDNLLPRVWSDFRVAGGLPPVRGLKI